MKTLVVYDSAFGNTKKIAEKIAKTLNGEAKLVNDFRTSDLKNIGLLIVGSPINGWMPLPSIMAFLNSFGSDDLKNIKATSFDTISKYVSELHTELQIHFGKPVITNQPKDGWIFNP